MATVCMRTVCVEAEQKNAKQTIEGLVTVRECQNILEEGELVGVASVACVMSICCPIFGILQEYYRRLLVLPDTFMYTTVS